jgi:D-beta-D-heptose 7-phosphate kinase/D-beta-D-heptose 1-phosphate adenosyltransferase
MNSLKRIIEGFSKKRVLVIGDVMLDRFIYGNVSRISPEAPVPVVSVEEETVYPGGAANVARNLVPFAGDVLMVGRVGRDRDGRILDDVLKEGRIGTSGIFYSPDCGTIAKNRVIARKQQVVRFDRETIVPLSAEHVEFVRQFVSEQVKGLDGLIVSDYGKGCITQELMDAVLPVARSAGVVVTVDPNPNNPLKWKGVTSVKPNRVEAFREAGVPDGHAVADPMKDKNLLRVGERLLEHWDTEIVQITLGEHGMMLFERNKGPHHIPTVAREVFDVSGAGDTAIALFTLALCGGATPVEAAEISNYASGVVVGKVGTATLTPRELLDFIAAQPVPHSTAR